MPKDRLVASGIRVLIADDHREVAETLGILLKSDGYDVRLVFSGLAAVKLAPRFKPQVVILDINMPGMDGFETAEKLRKQPWSKEAIYVAHTARSDALVLEKIEKAGFHHYALKPSGVDQFRAILGSARKTTPEPPNE